MLIGEQAKANLLLVHLWVPVRAVFCLYCDVLGNVIFISEALSLKLKWVSHTCLKK